MDFVSCLWYRHKLFEVFFRLFPDSKNISVLHLSLPPLYLRALEKDNDAHVF